MQQLSPGRFGNLLPTRPISVFICLWLLAFALYFITARAGWVTDTVDWQYRITHLDFWSYLNLVQTHVPSLYQLTQLVTFLLYKLFGFDRWLWHLLFLTLHALHATLWFAILRHIMAASGINRAAFVAFAAVLLYTAAPHISEVLVWKASFHYLLGGLLMALPLLLLQKYFRSGSRRYAVVSAFLYFLSTFSIEVFYLTPWMTLSVIIYYRSLPRSADYRTNNAIRLFFVPQLVLFAGHLVLLYIVTRAHIAHIGSEINQPLIAYLRKAPHYFFHILFLGRFFPHEWRQPVYPALTTTWALSLFYGALALLLVMSLWRFSKMRANNRPQVLFFLFLLMHLAMLSPLWLPDSQLVAYDRYTYLMLPFVYVLLVLLITRIRVRYVARILLAAYLLINCYFTLKANRLWQKSTLVVDSLTNTFPDPGKRTVLLLNLPENFNGVPMIGSLKESFFKLRYNIAHRPELTNQVYDVASFNISSPADGAHVKVVSDSTLVVTLNQWGTWWWYSFQGGRSYENEDFKLDMRDVGHWYELTIRKPADSMMLLFVNEGHWKVVDMSLRDTDQY